MIDHSVLRTLADVAIGNKIVYNIIDGLLAFFSVNACVTSIPSWI